MVTTVPAITVFLAAMVPLVAAAGCALPATRAFGRRLAPLAAVPALAAAAFVPDGTATIGWLLNGVTVGLDSTGRAFLVLAAFIWTAAGLYTMAHPPERPARFFGWFSLSMAGNLGLCCVTDPAGFYTFFAMMALPAYALVSYDGARAREAGRAYMAFTVVGEALLVCGLFVVAAAGAGITPGPVVGPVGVGLVLAAFGIKIGALGLHGWMPVSYAAAPAAAAAVLAGSMSKAGVLGLVRFLPGGESWATAFGPVVMAFGLAAAFYGAAVAVVQTEPKVVLAYSSISQFGLITIVIGAGLAEPVVWLLAVTAATVYSVHHGLAKAALFLGEDVAARSARKTLPVVALALPALALAGAPLTSGTVAKIVLKEATALAPGGWYGVLDTLLPFAAVGTTLIMARFLYLVATGGGAPREDRATAPGALGVAAWMLMLAAVAGALWLWPATDVRYAAQKSLTAHYLWLSAWPIILGSALAASAWFSRATSRRFVGLIPPADVYAPLLSAANRMIRTRESAIAAAPVAPAAPAVPAAPSDFLDRAGQVEGGLLAWATATSAIGALTVFFLILATRV